MIYVVQGQPTSLIRVKSFISLLFDVYRYLIEQTNKSSSQIRPVGRLEFFVGAVDFIRRLRLIFLDEIILNLCKMSSFLFEFQRGILPLTFFITFF